MQIYSDIYITKSVVLVLHREQDGIKRLLSTALTQYLLQTDTHRERDLSLWDIDNILGQQLGMGRYLNIQTELSLVLDQLLYDFFNSLKKRLNEVVYTFNSASADSYVAF